MSEQVPLEDPSGAAPSEVCPTSTPSNPTDIRKQRLSAIRAILHDSAVRDGARKTRRAAASERASQDMRFRRLEERYGWTHTEFLQYLALPIGARERWLDRERKRLKAPERKNANLKDMTPAERALHRTEQNRLAQQRKRAKLALRKADGNILLSDDELALFEDLESKKRPWDKDDLDEELLEDLWAAAATQDKAG